MITSKLSRPVPWHVVVVAFLVSGVLSLARVSTSDAQVTGTVCPTGPSGQSNQTAVQCGNLVQVTEALPAQRDFVVTPVNKAACTATDQPVQINYNTTAASAQITSNARLQIYLSDNTSCAASSDMLYNELYLSSVTPLGQFPNPVDVTRLSLKKLLDKTTACATETDTGRAAVCVVIDNVSASGNAPARHVGFLQVNIDTKPPGAPLDVVAESGDSSVLLRWTAPSTDVSTYVVTTFDMAGTVLRSDSVALVTNLRIDKLTNGTQYQFAVRARDAAGNEGPDAALVQGTPRDECDFWKCYEGQERGGYCFITTAAFGSYQREEVRAFRAFRDLVLAKSDVGRSLILAYYRHGAKPAIWLARHETARDVVASLLIVPAAAVQFALGSSGSDLALASLCVLALLWLATRRHQPASSLILGLFVLFAASPAAWAQSDSAFADEFERRNDAAMYDERGENDRPWLGFNLKFGTYRPNIDADPAAGGFYRLFFGNSDQFVTGAGRKLRVDFEGDFYFLRSFGLLGVSGSVGYWQASGRTRVCKDAGGAVVACTLATISNAELTKNSTNLTLFPLSVSIIYKLDILREKYSIPIVPYARLGLDLVLWRADSAGKEAKRRNGRTGNGSTYGWHFRPGVAIALDWLEPDTARRAFHSAGIHGTYLTFEWIFTDLSDFRSNRSWDLSDSSFLAGLTVDMGF